MKYANGVKATTLTTGTGDVTLAAVSGYVPFPQAFSVGDQVPYAIRNGQNWEWGIGTVQAGGVLERTTVASTLVAGVFTDVAPARITLTGVSEVVCAITAEDYRALNDSLLAHTADVANPHGVTAAQANADEAGTAAGLVAAHAAALDPHNVYPLEADLGTAAFLDAGTAVGDLVQVQAGGALPALDASALLNLPESGLSQGAADLLYAPIAKGVTGGDAHDHSGGDVAQIAYASLSGRPTLGTAAAAATGDFEAVGAVSTHNAVATAHGISAWGATLVDDADAATARTTLVLGNVDNTRDVNKPVSTAQQTALNLKAPTASPTFTGPITAGGSVFITEEGTYPRVSVSGYSTAGWQGPMFQWNRFSGTLLSPLAVANGFTLGWFDVWGYDGSALARGGQFRCLVDGSVSTGIVPAKWQLLSTDNTGALRVRIDLLASDNVNVGQNGGSLNVGGGDSSAAKVRIISTTEQLRVGYDATKYLSVITSSAGIPTLSSTASTLVFAGDIRLDKTITAGGTTGARTINNTLGSVNFAAGASSLVVTNSRVTTSSIIIATVATADATMKSVAAVAAAGSFTLHANAAATAETRVNFNVFN